MPLEHRPITPADTGAWSVLTNALAAADGTGERYAPGDLAEELLEPGFTPAFDSTGVWDGDRMVGYGQLRVKAVLLEGQAMASIHGGVHPAYRGRGVGRAIMDRMEARASGLSAQRHPGAPVRLNVWAPVPDSGTARLAAARGYVPVRYFQDMRLDLYHWQDPDPGGPSPRAVPFEPRHAEAVRLAHNEAFADHWGSTPRTPEAWADMLASRSARPELSRVALAEPPAGASLDPAGPGAPATDSPTAHFPTAGSPAGAVDSYVLCAEWVPGTLHVNLVGTRRRARGRGLAALLLTDAIRAAREAGYRYVELGVDSESPTGAVGLYERVGFTKVRTNAVYSRLL
ncbi:N-acetyltransferase [Zafaria cholistanensis]|uniref:N-acetyltransferase n=1 Tax=Zafaria cholistanensis TaxID=1682741 RepID=A0A5A7NQ87_9MICC|nr:GNAT family N-acetyltransferase [Zafaria cholistanensis]GER22960.1 N-acetyltransferase [Zafaria cholistanensis]